MHKPHTEGLLAALIQRSERLPLRSKVRLVILSVAVVALLTVVGAVFAYQIHVFRTGFARDLDAVAGIIANNCSPALDFADPKAAVETLAALQAKPGIVSATIVAQDGKHFAHFGLEETAASVAEFSTGSQFSTDRRHWLHTEPIVRDAKQLGFVRIRADYAARRSELLNGVIVIMAGVLAASIAIVLVLTGRLQTVITRPISQLADAAREVARRNDYSVRVAKEVDDEVGQLTDAFNQMLGEIQRQDSALQTARENLEHQVEALAVSETRFRGVVENLGEALLLVGLSGETLFMNPRFTALLGWTEEDLDGRDALKVLMPDNERYGLLLTHGAPDQKDSALEVQLMRRDGTKIWTEIHASPMRDPDGGIIGTLAAILDITARRLAAEELEEINKQLVGASRRAGMAEVATGVLHNVGNVLNSVNVGAALALEKLRSSKVVNLGKAAELLASKNGELAAWLTTDPQGQRMPGYLGKLSTHLAVENTELIHELDQVARNVEHIKEIVSVQQSYACVSGLTEVLPPGQLVEDAVRMNTAKFSRHGIEVIRRYSPTPPVSIDKHKVLQILVNLISNAKHALDASPDSDRRITIGIEPGDDGFVRVSVTDNGIGIPRDNLTRIFQHGFTTKKNGHGFGLHSGALAAREMGGSLTVHSDGPGTGSTFTLSLPIASALAAA